MTVARTIAGAFADRVQGAIERSGSFLVAGCDPVLDRLPAPILAAAEKDANTDEQFVDRALGIFCDLFLDGLSGNVAAVKPNTAFFEQYGLAGLTKLHDLCKRLKALEIPVIMDAKRGDIGNTAAAYSNTFIGRTTVRGRSLRAFEGDAVTVSPYLGFDTLDPFIADCREFGAGIFVLVQTSNPGSKDIQGLECRGSTVSGRVADWLAGAAESLRGACGWSGLGAVVGATYPEDAVELRRRMPTNLFLIPGLGAQGGSADDALAGFGVQNGKLGGGLVNVSRGLLEGKPTTLDEVRTMIAGYVLSYGTALREAAARVSASV